MHPMRRSPCALAQRFATEPLHSFARPSHAIYGGSSSIDPQTEAVRTIDCGVEGNGKWSGMVAVGHTLYCAPCNASTVLVVDPTTEKLSFIEGAGALRLKYRGICE